MKNVTTLAIALLSILTLSTSCSKQEQTPHKNTAKEVSVNPHAISVSDANIITSSYDASTTQGDLKSFTFEANTIRSIVEDPAVTHVTIHLAHTLEYVQQHPGQPSGYKNLTVVVYGRDVNGTIMLNKEQGYDEHAFPCPGSSFCD